MTGVVLKFRKILVELVHVFCIAELRFTYILSDVSGNAIGLNVFCSVERIFEIEFQFLVGMQTTVHVDRIRSFEATF